MADIPLEWVPFRRNCVIELPPGRPRLDNDELNRLIRHQRLGWAIAQTMIVDHLAKSIDLDDNEVTALITKFLESLQIHDADARSAYLEAEGISEEDLIWRATTERRLEIHRHDQHGSDVESLYLERKLDLDQVIYSLIRVRDPDLAFELYQQIQEGEADFRDLASQYSEGQERESQGLVGPVPLGVAHPELLNRLRSAQLGQLLEPFFVVDIWLLIRLEQTLPAQLDDSLRRQLEQELFNTWLQEQTLNLLAGGDLPTLHGSPSPVA